MNGEVSTIATHDSKSSKDAPSETESSYCRGLCVDPKGTIYVAATGTRRVLKIVKEYKRMNSSGNFFFT